MQKTLSLTSHLINQTENFLTINKEKDTYAKQNVKVFGKALTVVALITLETAETLALAILTVATAPLYLSVYTRPVFQTLKNRLVMTQTTANDIDTSQKIEPAKAEAEPKKKTPPPFSYKKAAMLTVGTLAIVASIYFIVKHQEAIQKWVSSIKNPLPNESPLPSTLNDQPIQKTQDIALKKVKLPKKLEVKPLLEKTPENLPEAP